MDSEKLLEILTKEIRKRGTENYCRTATELKYKILDQVEKSLTIYSEEHLISGFIKYIETPSSSEHINVLSFYFMIADYLDSTYFPIIEFYAGPIEIEIIDSNC